MESHATEVLMGRSQAESGIIQPSLEVPGNPGEHVKKEKRRLNLHRQEQASLKSPEGAPLSKWNKSVETTDLKKENYLD